MDEFLKEAMRERGWKVPRLAEECDVNPGLAARWVSPNPRYRVTPSPASCKKIADALGVDPDFILDLAGHRSRHQPAVEVSAKRQAVRDQLDRWLSAVGVENEEFFWAHLKAQGDSAVDLIRRIGIAVNATADSAVNGAVSGRAERGRKRRDDADGPLIGSYLAAHQHLTAPYGAFALGAPA